MAKLYMIFDGKVPQVRTPGDSLPIKHHKQVNKTTINFHNDKSIGQQRRRTV